MLPAEHPEFFRRPPPPGQSRESSIRLDAEGRFWHAGELVAHPGMQAAFATWIRRHPDDGRYVLCNGYDWTYLSVEDAPFFVRSVREMPAGLELGLSDGTWEQLDPGSLHLGAVDPGAAPARAAPPRAKDALYCRVKSGSFEARFNPGAQTALSPYLVEGPAGEPLLEVAGQRFAIA